eukprot:COSAG02_NODE_578_length_20075_cov_93.607930_6_plen_141_part_00
MADGADALTPPASWAYWAWDAFKGPNGAMDKRWGAITRNYPMRIAGQLLGMRGGGSKTRFVLEMRTGSHVDISTCAPGAAAPTPSASTSVIYFAHGLKDATVTVWPRDALVFQTYGPTEDQILHLCNRQKETRVSISIEK